MEKAGLSQLGKRRNRLLLGKQRKETKPVADRSPGDKPATKTAQTRPYKTGGPANRGPKRGRKRGRIA